MKISRIKVILIILAVVFLGTIVTLGYFIWDFHRPVEYVTREPVYHERFPSDSHLVQVYQGNGVVVNYSNGRLSPIISILIIDIETGRELMRFENSENRRYENIYLHGDGKVSLSRSSRAGFFDNTMIFERALLEVESGREIIPFGREYSQILQVFNGFAIVERRFERPECELPLLSDFRFGLKELESGEMILPFEYTFMRFLSENFIAAAIYGKGEIGRTRDILNNSYWGVINVNTGEIVWPFIYGYIRPVQVGTEEITWPITFGGISPPQMGEENLVRFACRSDDFLLVNITTGEVLIQSNQFISSAGYGMAVVTQREPHVSKLIEIESSREIIPFGIYYKIEILNENSVLVQANHWQGFNADFGIINVHDGKEVTPIGNYRFFNTYMRSGRFFHYEGMIFAMRNSERAIIDVATGEEIIQFGTYHISRLLPGGYMKVWSGGYWWIDKVRR